MTYPQDRSRVRALLRTPEPAAPTPLRAAEAPPVHVPGGAPNEPLPLYAAGVCDRCEEPGATEVWQLLGVDVLRLHASCAPFPAWRIRELIEQRTSGVLAFTARYGWQLLEETA